MGRTRNQNLNPTRKKKQPPTSSSSSSSSSLSLSIRPQSSKTEQPHHHILSHQRKSYYFTRELTPPPQPPPHDAAFCDENPKSKSLDTHFLDVPRKPSKQGRGSAKRNRASSNRPSAKLVNTSVSAGCGCRSSLESVYTKPDSISEDYPGSPLDCSTSDLDCHLLELGSDHNHIHGHGLRNDLAVNTTEVDRFNTIIELELPPIITKKPSRFSDEIKNLKNKKKEEEEENHCNECEESNAHGSLSVKVVKNTIISSPREQRSSPVKRRSAISPGVKLRTNSPRIASRKIQAHCRKSVSSSSPGSAVRTRRSLSDSLAVVKSSADPQRDFRESMVEMILENNIRASKDLEDLLACYLQLNSDEYHELIIKVFKQIWFDLADVRLK
ncbi:hypothetical protein U1Q18_008635 [Sarracenia purpurea var. burkii]